MRSCKKKCWKTPLNPVIASALKRLFTPDPSLKQAHDAYVQVVTQSRRPVFYSDWQAPDTLDGRFDIILLHLSLLIHRIESEPQSPGAKHFVRILSEVFFADMDQSLRELGASDTGVGKRIKHMAQAFYGRLKAYGEALAQKADQTDGLGDAISRNIYRDNLPSPALIEAWVAYAKRNMDTLRAQPVAVLMRGEVTFSE